MTTQPLVSVAVITYNSASTVLETLDSVLHQSYQNLELVISDDGSSDNTLELCNKWLENKKKRFANIKLVTSKMNTGISANCNRALDSCQGTWVKEIAGDDLLLPNCISDFMDYVQSHASAKFIFGKMVFFDGDESTYSNMECDYSFFELPIDKQLHHLIYVGDCLHAPASFFNRGYIKQIGFRYDERIPMMEDYPKWIRLLQLGVRFFFMDKDVVKYRVGVGISTQRVPGLLFYRSEVLCNLYYRYPVMLDNDMEDGINRIVDDFCEQYKNRFEIERLKNTKSFRVGKAILKLFYPIKKFFR